MQMFRVSRSVRAFSSDKQTDLTTGLAVVIDVDATATSPTTGSCKLSDSFVPFPRLLVSILSGLFAA